MGFSPALSHCSHASSQLNPYTDHPIHHFEPCKLRNRRSWRGREGLLRAGGSRAAIAVGEQIPDVSLSFIDKQGNLQTISTSALTRGKKVVLFAVPGAFTPTCTQRHLPGFVQNSYELKRRGVHTIACISVNDVFVLKAWQQSLGVDEDKVLLLSDGNAHFTTAMGAILDLRGNILGLGVRSCRYSLLAEDGVVKLLHLEDGGMFTRSGADDILKHLQTW